MEYNQYITNESERKTGKHLTSEDRGAIQAMKKLGCSNRKIAAYLHCSPTTVSHELKRGTPPKKATVESYQAIQPNVAMRCISPTDETAASLTKFASARHLSSGSLSKCARESGRSMPVWAMRGNIRFFRRMK